MGTKESILRILSERDLLESDVAKGVATQAIARGVETLTDKQKYVLKGYFNPVCEGDRIHDCEKRLTDIEYLSALEHYSDNISCFDCMAQIEHQDHAWAKMEKE